MFDWTSGISIKRSHLILGDIEDKVEDHDNLLLIAAQVWSVLASRDCMVDHQVFRARPHPSVDVDNAWRVAFSDSA